MIFLFDTFLANESGRVWAYLKPCLVTLTKMLPLKTANVIHEYEMIYNVCVGTLYSTVLPNARCFLVCYQLAWLHANIWCWKVAFDTKQTSPLTVQCVWHQFFISKKMLAVFPRKSPCLHMLYLQGLLFRLLPSSSSITTLQPGGDQLSLHTISTCTHYTPIHTRAAMMDGLLALCNAQKSYPSPSSPEERDALLQLILSPLAAAPPSCVEVVPALDLLIQEGVGCREFQVICIYLFLIVTSYFIHHIYYLCPLYALLQLFLHILHIFLMSPCVHALHAYICINMVCGVPPCLLSSLFQEATDHLTAPYTIRMTDYTWILICFHICIHKNIRYGKKTS